jgi:hypothetical protein
MSDTTANNPTPITTPDEPPIAKPYLEVAGLKDVLHKELEMIQAIVTRMGGNSFQCKGWLIGIFAFVMAMNKDSNLFGPWVLVLIGPLFLFWYLDGFFLYVEQRYRDLYRFTVKKRTNPDYIAQTHTGKELSAKNSFYDLNYTNFEHQELLDKSVFMHFRVSVRSFFNGTKHNPSIDVLNKVQPPLTIGSVMVSKTLAPFYGMIFLFIVTIASSEKLKNIFSSGADTPKEPISIKLDSATLQILQKYGQMPVPVQVTVEMPPVIGAPAEKAKKGGE